MSRIAICQGETIHSLVQNGKRTLLPNGILFCGPAVNLPVTVGSYTLRAVEESGPLPGPGERPASAPPAIVNEVVVIQRSVIPAPPSYAKDQLLEYVENRRWLAEIGGITWNTWKVATDREASQGKISSSYTLARDGYWPEGSGWKFADGVFRILTGPEMIAMALAVAAHIQSCFSLESTLAGNVNNNTVTTKAQIDAAFAELELASNPVPDPE